MPAGLPAREETAGDPESSSSLLHGPKFAKDPARCQKTYLPLLGHTTCPQTGWEENHPSVIYYLTIIFFNIEKSGWPFKVCSFCVKCLSRLSMLTGNQNNLGFTQVRENITFITSEKRQEISGVFWEVYLQKTFATSNSGTACFLWESSSLGE